MAYVKYYRFRAAKRGTHQDVGFPNTAYGMSKIGLTAVTCVLQRQVDNKYPDKDIVFNAVSLHIKSPCALLCSMTDLLFLLQCCPGDVGTVNG